MPRNMSFALTTAQFKARTKTVTRRTGWLHAKAGDIVCGVKKCQGLKKGDKVEQLGMIRLTDVRREPLNQMCMDVAYGVDEVAREGFPEMDPLEFVLFFCETHACKPGATVTRIEYEYVD